MKLKTIIYSNPTSPFGNIFLENVLKSDLLEIDKIVLSSVNLGWRFHLKLKGENYSSPSKKAIKKYNKKISIIKKWITLYAPKTQIRFISNANTKKENQFLKSYKVAICAAFPQIFKPIFFQATEWGIINFHPSYLPRCRGAHPIYWTIANQEEYGGISSHFITEKIDHGTIIHRLKIPIDKNEIDYEKLFRLVNKHLPIAIKGCIEHLKRGKTVTNITEQASYNKNEQDEDCEIDWSKDNAESISVKIRSGGAFSYLQNGERIYLTNPLFINKNTRNNHSNGAIINISKKGILIQTLNAQLLCSVEYRIHSFLERIIMFLLKIHKPTRRQIRVILWKIKFRNKLFIEKKSK